MNLTFKRYFESAVNYTVRDDFITDIGGSGADARLIEACSTALPTAPLRQAMSAGPQPGGAL